MKTGSLFLSLILLVGRQGLPEEFCVLVIQGVEARGLLHVVGELVGHGGEDLVLPGLLVLAGQQGGEGAVVEDDVPPQQVVAILCDGRRKEARRGFEPRTALSAALGMQDAISHVVTACSIRALPSSILDTVFSMACVKSDKRQDKFVTDSQSNNL